MLLRISLILAIIAGLAVGALNFTKVKEKITTLQANLKEQTDGRVKAEGELRFTKSSLDKTNAILKQTQTVLAKTTQEKETALKDLDAKTKVADRLAMEKDKALKDLDDAKGALEAYRLTEMKPEEIIAFKKQYKGLQDQIAEQRLVIGGQGKKIKNLENELAQYKDPEKPVFLPAALKGKIEIMDPKWNFVVVNVGEDQGVLERGELLVNRNGKLVAKVRVRSVMKDRCVANVVPGWQVGEILEGDLVIPAHPAS